MKKKLFCKKKILLFSTFLFVFGACSSEAVSESTMDNDVCSHLNISIDVPGSDDIVVKGCTRAGISSLPKEAEVKTLNVYLFLKNASGSTESDYKYIKGYSYSDGNLKKEADGKLTCSIGISNQLMDKTVKVVLIANDKSNDANIFEGKTTLQDFRSVLATAEVSDSLSSAILVGNDMKGFPMSAVSGDIRLTAAGASVHLPLLRNVARIDIHHNAPGLIIKSMELLNVNSKSFLLASADGRSVNVPDSVRKIRLLPVRENEIAYNPEDSLNYHVAFYLYEQSVYKEEDSPVVKIDYMIPGGNKKAEIGQLLVKFQRTSGNRELIDVKRNNRYLIQLGDGRDVRPGTLRAEFDVVNWTNYDYIVSEFDPNAELIK